MDKQTLNDLIATGTPGDTFSSTEDGVEFATLISIEDDENGRKHVAFVRTKLFPTAEGYGGAHSVCTAITSSDRTKTLARDTEYSMFSANDQDALPSLDEAKRLNAEYLEELDA